jgi:hypothetical protein
MLRMTVSSILLSQNTQDIMRRADTNDMGKPHTARLQLVQALSVSPFDFGMIPCRMYMRLTL